MSRCFVHPTHQDAPESLDHHHVLPVAWWNSPENTETVPVCPNGHRDTHVYLDRLVAGKGIDPPWPVRRQFPALVRSLARTGYDDAIARGITPRRTL